MKKTLWLRLGVFCSITSLLLHADVDLLAMSLKDITETKTTTTKPTKKADPMDQLREDLGNAIQNNDVAAVKEAIKNGAQIDHVIFKQAIRGLNIDIVKILKELSDKKSLGRSWTPRVIAEEVEKTETVAEKKDKIRELIKEVWELEPQKTEEQQEEESWWQRMQNFWG